ncbi:sulfotransferase family protein [Dyella terrae]|uniref:sulfotransferase family protein n=1 Tax=Dyella terrae TaxID=522259 RepID=UPI001EFE8A92|nr:sulfotransferase [Dyella terrae]ULU25350.1 sulfotransferase [Dyella terrae]
MRRTFVVGCPRSGTTIVQALLARHPAVYTLPETAFFEQLHGDLTMRWGDARMHIRRLRRWRQTLGLTRRHARETYAALHVQLTGKRPAMLPTYHHQSLSQRFLAVLDRSAASAERSMWLEKTPNHLLYIPEIEAAAPDARFVHVVRRGMDVLASLADVYLRFENDDAFGGGTVHWARRWNRAMEIHGQHVGRTQHHFVFLEDLVRQPDNEWARLCAFLELPPDAPLENANHQPIANLKDEPWKLSAIGGQVREADRKVDSLFGPKLQRWLHGRLVSYEDLHAQCQATRATLVSRTPKTAGILVANVG